MARDPHSRHELQHRLEQAIGREATETLMEALPPHPWNELATKADIDERFARFEARIDERFTRIDQQFARADERFTRIDERFTRFDERFTRIDEQFARADERMDLKMEALEHRLSAAFHSELIGMTKTIMYSQIGVVISVATAVIAGAKFL